MEEQALHVRDIGRVRRREKNDLLDAGAPSQSAFIDPSSPPQQWQHRHTTDETLTATVTDHRGRQSPQSPCRAVQGAVWARAIAYLLTSILFYSCETLDLPYGSMQRAPND